jgi:hypothetical protein
VWVLLGSNPVFPYRLLVVTSVAEPSIKLIAGDIEPTSSPRRRLVGRAQCRDNRGGGVGSTWVVCWRSVGPPGQSC